MLKALAKDPAQRYGDADSFIKDLEVVEERLRQGPVDVESTAVFAPMAATTAPTALARRRRWPPSPRPPPAVAEPAPPPPPSRGAARGRRPTAPAALARGRRWSPALAVLALIAFLVFGSQEQVTVPPVVGPDAGAGACRVDRAGLDVEVKRRTDQAPRDFVFEQSPNPGQQVDKGSLVTLFVSNGSEHRQGPRRRRPRPGGRPPAPARGRDLRPQVERESSTKVADGHRDPHRSRVLAGRPNAIPR